VTALVNIDGVSIAVRRIGRGQPVVCLSAICHDSRDFDALAERCGERFEFICLEWPDTAPSSSSQTPSPRVSSALPSP
jgi:hypothetical protein